VRRNTRDKSEQFRVKTVATSCGGGMQAQKRRHVCDLPGDFNCQRDREERARPEHSASCVQIEIIG
jgi:hypothetical protein